MNHVPRRIIVLGASSGGAAVLQTVVAGLPPDLPAALFIVWHMAPNIDGVLPQVLARVGPLPAGHARDGAPIVAGHIYVAPPDRHLLLERGQMRVTHGPKENRFRPAVDPLFRSAAYAYGTQVIGVVLTGALDDGTAGLWLIKRRGGIAIVQDPADAEVASMPESALRAVAVDYVAPAQALAALLVRLVEAETPAPEAEPREDERTELEIKIAAGKSALGIELMKHGRLTPYTRPECQGVLSLLAEGRRERFRCHTGHAYSADVLLASLTENIEDNLYNAIRSIDESIMLLNHIGDHYAEENQPKLAALYFRKAQDAESRAVLVRQAALAHEQLSQNGLRQQADFPRPAAGLTTARTQKRNAVPKE